MAKERSVRVGAAGIIIQDGKILLVKFDDEHGPHYNYPGGGHQEGETLRKTAAREVKEETDADVQVGRLLVTAESAPFEVEYVYGKTHFLKLSFECTLKPGSKPRLPDKPDLYEVAVEWVSIEQLAELPVIPDISVQLIAALNDGTPSFFEDNGRASMELDNK
jgi:ADP-ribose pyrophosphatase YjhB (NUDIX family)